MPQVEFHILSETGEDARMRYACQLVDSASQQQRAVFVCVESTAAAQRMDELLWTFRDQAFIPHEIAGEYASGQWSSDPLIRTLIGTADSDRNLSGVRLINLSTALPAQLEGTELILEVVDDEPAHKQQARERYKQYRDKGWPLNTVNS